MKIIMPKQDWFDTPGHGPMILDEYNSLPMLVAGANNVDTDQPHCMMTTLDTDSCFERFTTRPLNRVIGYQHVESSFVSLFKPMDVASGYGFTVYKIDTDHIDFQCLTTTFRKVNVDLSTDMAKVQIRYGQPGETPHATVSPMTLVGRTTVEEVFIIIRMASASFTESYELRSTNRAVVQVYDTANGLFKPRSIDLPHMAKHLPDQVLDFNNDTVLDDTGVVALLSCLESS